MWGKVLRDLTRELDMTIVETRPVKTNKPVLLTGFQTPGMVGVTAVSHMINSLRMSEVAYLRSRFIPTVKLIVGPEFRTLNPFRIYANSTGEVLAFVNDSPAGSIGLSPFFNDIGRTVVDWFHEKDVRLLVALGSFPVQKKERAKLVAYSTDSERLKELTKLGITPLQSGFIGGIVVSIIDECIKRGIPWLMLFAPTRKMGEVDLEAVQMILEGVNKILGLNIDTESLKMARAGRRGLLRSLRRR
ncbi:hypothetical protein DRO56_01260 [Candidatus Bathyarchaeota archaeon]|nr:MAG: proteasome assembly chaperone family protein [Candidatus Bathyarchaeota archaeon]RLI33630.1 MAG: hypothetical protein DRO56_01260 [Candidatus Bathyarchaeota archaeon]